MKPDTGIPPRPIVRREREDERQEVHKIARAAFGQEDEAVLVDMRRQVPEYEPRLSLVALSGGHITGHILFTRLYCGPDAAPFLTLAPLAVRPDCQH